MEHGLEVKFPAALLEKVFETLPEQVHDHDVVHLAVFGLLVADEVQEGDEGLASELVNQLALPKQHDVALHLNCFFLSGVSSPVPSSPRGPRALERYLPPLRRGTRLSCASPLQKVSE